MKKTAIVLGATGLVGSNLTRQLIENQSYDRIKILSRRTLGISHEKIKEFIVDFENIDAWHEKITGDVLFSSMGTTIKAAGSKEAQYKVDFTYQYEVAKAARENGVKQYILVSSAGADQNSKFFYMNMKGKLDEAIRNLNFPSATILRPATLVGKRPEERAGENVAIKITGFLTRIIPPLRKYRPIDASIVAKAMVHAAQNKQMDSFKIYAFEQVFNLAEAE